jgi:hypothetical protein
VEHICLDQNALHIKLAEQRCEHRPLVVLASGVAGLADRQNQSRHVHLAEEVAEGGIGGRTAEFNAQCLGEHAVVADGIGEAFSEGVAL